MNPLALLALARKYWKVAAGIALALALWWAWHQHYRAGFKAGKAEVQSLWNADYAKRQQLQAKMIADDQAHEAATAARNEERAHAYETQIADIAADRDSLSGRMHDYENRVRGLTAEKATDQLGLDVASRIASSAASATAEIDRLYDAYDSACRRDAVKLTALQDEIRPQL